MRRQKFPDGPTYQQADLFDLPIDCPSQPVDTSEAAADSMRSVAGTLRARVLVAVWENHGLTQDEYSARFDSHAQTACPRFWELENRGWLYKSDEKRLTRSGRWARIYQPTEGGALVAARLAAAFADLHPPTPADES